MALRTVREVCAALPDADKDVVFISAMMEAYAHNDRNDKCLALFRDIQLRRINERMRADKVCFAKALNACMQAMTLHLNRATHRELAQNAHLRHMLREPDIEWNPIDLRLPQSNAKNVNVGNVMIHALGRIGYITGAFAVAARMDAEGVAQTQRRTFCC